MHLKLTYNEVQACPPQVLISKESEIVKDDLNTNEPDLILKVQLIAAASYKKQKV